MNFRPNGEGVELTACYGELTPHDEALYHAVAAFLVARFSACVCLYTTTKKN